MSKIVLRVDNQDGLDARSAFSAQDFISELKERGITPPANVGVLLIDLYSLAEADYDNMDISELKEAIKTCIADYDEEKELLFSLGSLAVREDVHEKKDFDELGKDQEYISEALTSLGFKDITKILNSYEYKSIFYKGKLLRLDDVGLTEEFK